MLKLEDFIIKENIRKDGYINKSTLYKVYCVCCNIDRGYLTTSRYKSKPLCIKCSTNTKSHKEKLSKNHWSKKGLEPHNKGQKQPFAELHDKIRVNLRNRLNKAIIGDFKSGSAVSDLGCSIKEFKAYLESKFKPGMTWDNWARDGWHIDHIVPLASFDLSNISQLKEACHYTNLQPLWAIDNLKKSDKVNTGII